MSNKKYRKSPTGWEGSLKTDKVNYDVNASLNDMVRLFDLVRIKFDIHIELATKENKLSSSLTGIQQQFLKLNKAMAKLYV